MQPITKDSLIEDIVRNYPVLVKPLMEFGIKCVVCGEPLWGTLEESAREKSIKNLDEIVVTLNKIVKEKGAKGSVSEDESKPKFYLGTDE